MTIRQLLITLLLTFFSSRCFSIELALEGDWIPVNDELDIISSKLLVKRSNGLVMASPYKQMLVKGDGWVKYFHQYEGHTVDFQVERKPCFDIAASYKTGSNLLVLKLFKINGTNITELPSDIHIVSNLNNILIEANLVTATNQITIGDQRVEKVTEYIVVRSEIDDKCVIESVVN